MSYHTMNDSFNITEAQLSLKCHFLAQFCSTLMRLSHRGKVFTVIMVSNRLLHSSCCKICDLTSVVTGTKII